MKANRRTRFRSRMYEPEHRRLRSALAPLVAAGGMSCIRCGEPIEPGTPWDLGHDDRDPRRHAGPEHASLQSRCSASQRDLAGTASRI